MTKMIIKTIGKAPKMRKPILIEGLPGIGNVGKVAVDFLIEELKGKKIIDIISYSFPHSVFVNEDNLVELPKIALYHIKSKRDIILLSGDVQPMDEVSSYEFSEKILDIIEGFNCKEIVTLGGIGLSEVPKKPKLYCTGNDKSYISKYKDKLVIDKIYGVVGPIVGVSGLLLGLSKERNIKALSILAETYAHPMYLGMQGAKLILKLLDKKLGLGINLKRLDRDIKDIESEMMKKTEELNEVMRQTALQKLEGKIGKDMTYIG